MADADGRVVFEYVGDTSGIDKANTEAENKMKALGTKMLSVIGYAAIAKAAIDTGKAVVQIGSDFESAFAGVLKTVDGTKEDLSEIRTGILDMSKVLPASAVEISGVAEAAGQLGIETENVLKFTQAMIDMGESTNMTADQAATQLARFANIMGMPQDKFEKLGSTIVDLGNNSATTEAEIVAMGLRIAGAGKQANMAEADIMGIAASLSSLGIEAEAGGTAISKVITDINVAVQTGSSALEDYAYVAGMSASQFRAAFEDDAAGALAKFIEGLGTMDERGSSAVLTLQNMGIEEIRMRDALLRASGAGDLMTESIERGNEAWEENEALTTEASKRYETLESRAGMLGNRVKDLAIRFFDGLRPALGDVVTELDNMLARMSEDGTIDSFAAATGSLITTLGDLIVILGNLSTVLSPVAIALGVVVDMVNILIGAVGTLVNWFLALFYVWNKDLNLAYWEKAAEYAEKITDVFSSSGATNKAISSLLQSSGSQSYGTSKSSSAYAMEEATGGLSSPGYTDEDFYADWGYYPGNAKGTSYWRGGLTWVGEDGPELANLPVGTQIYPAEMSAKMLSATPSTKNTGMSIGQMNVYPNSADYARLLALAEEAAGSRQRSRAGGN